MHLDDNIFFCPSEIIRYSRPSVVLYIVVVTITCIYIGENQSLSLHLSFLILYHGSPITYLAQSTRPLALYTYTPSYRYKVFLFHSSSCSSPFYVRLFCILKLLVMPDIGRREIYSFETSYVCSTYNVNLRQNAFLRLLRFLIYTLFNK